MKKLAMILAVIAVSTLVSSASARFVETHADSMDMTYTASSGQLQIVESEWTAFKVALKEGGPKNVGAVVDQTRIINDGTSYFDYDLTMNLVQNGVNDWEAVSGSLNITDVDTGTPAISAANFKSTDIAMNFGVLTITGVLWVDNPDTESILVNRGDPWVYTGTDTMMPDGDNDTTVTYNVDEYDTGGVLVIDFSLPGNISSLDELFGGDRTLEDGQLKINVVPVPAAGLLAMVGLGIVARLRRRFV